MHASVGHDLIHPFIEHGFSEPMILHKSKLELVEWLSSIRVNAESAFSKYRTECCDIKKPTLRSWDFWIEMDSKIVLVELNEFDDKVKTY